MPSSHLLLPEIESALSFLSNSTYNPSRKDSLFKLQDGQLQKLIGLEDFHATTAIHFREISSAIGHCQSFSWPSKRL